MSVRNIPYLFMALALIGLIDAFYLSYATYTATSLECLLLEGCNAVAASPYSRLFGMPLSYLGVLYYIGVLGIGTYIILHGAQNRRLMSLMLAFTILGGLMSIWFVWVQVTLIRALCVYCLVSSIITWILVLLAYTLWKTSASTVVLESADA